jgi:hypothetical protein
VNQQPEQPVDPKEEEQRSQFPEVTGPLYPDLSGLGYRGGSGGPIRTSAEDVPDQKPGEILSGSEGWTF